MTVMVSGRRMMQTLMSSDGLDPYQRLAAAVIIQAFSDTREYSYHHTEARKWFSSEYCLFWMTALLPKQAREWQQFCEQQVNKEGNTE